MEKICTKKGEGFIGYQLPKDSQWRVKITDGFWIQPKEHHEIPNWFHRMMQRLCFGFKWEKME